LGLAGISWSALAMVTKEQTDALIFKYAVGFCPHGESILMSIFAFFAYLFGTKNWKEEFWLTLGRTIYHPDKFAAPANYVRIVSHELVHVKQQSETYLVWWVIKYICSWRFRWKMERAAYLMDVSFGVPIAFIADTLIYNYKIKLSAYQIRDWFKSHVSSD